MATDKDNLMPLYTDQLLEWLDDRYPRPLYKATRGDSGTPHQFLIDTGKRQLIEDLKKYWADQTTPNKGA